MAVSNPPSEIEQTAREEVLPEGTTAYYKRLHTWLRRAIYVCLFALVVEGTLFVPFLVVWYGWPTLSMHEICDELQKVMYSDETRQCKYPYPLLSPAEAAGEQTSKDTWGVQPKPHYPRLGFRQLVTIHEQRLAREAQQHNGTGSR